MHRLPFDLPCGCSTCGCACAEHSSSRVAEPCGRHAALALARFVTEESARLVCLALFVSAVAVWAAILG